MTMIPPIHGNSMPRLHAHRFSTTSFLKKARLFLFITLALFQISATTFSQKISFKGRGVSLENVFNAITKQTGYVVFCNYSLIKNAKKVSVDARDEELNDFLKEVLKDQLLEYAIEGRTIIITKLAKPLAQNLVAKAAIIEPTTSSSVHGRVVNEKNEPLAGVTVALKNAQNITVTNDNGEYTINNVDEGGTLLFSYVGYLNAVEKIGGRHTIDVIMAPAVNALDQVVIIGYGAVKKKDVTGSVYSIKGDDLRKPGSPSVGNMLQGKATGLVITQTNASPGGALNFRIRGADRDPLIIIDGFPVSSLNDMYFSEAKKETGTNLSSIKTDNNFIGINPEDIETIDILKDASATSIYGARAANGVILITTKRGKNSKLSVTYSTSSSIQKLYGLPDVLSGKDYMLERNKITKEVWMNNNNVYPYGTIPFDNAMNSQIAYPYSDQDIQNFTGGTNWMKEVTRTGVIQSHNFNISAGTDKTKYLFSVSSYKDKAVLKDNNFSRLTARLNLDQQFNKWLTGGITSSYSRNKFDNVFGEGGRSGGAQFAGVISSALEFNPLLPIRTPDGKYALNQDRLIRPNPVSFLDALDKTDRSDLLGNVYAEITPFKGLSVKGTAGVDLKDNTRSTYLPSTITIGNQETSLAYLAQNKREDYLYNLRATYNFQLANKHKFSLMAAYEFQQLREKGLTMLNSNFPTDDFTWNNMSSGARVRPDVTSYLVSSQRASYISRLTYSFLDKYLLTANLRVDGSSNFAKNKQWGKFPGVSGAWKISEENFFKNHVAWLSTLKLRTGYGLVGDDNNLTGTYTYFSDAGTAWAFNNTPTSGLRLSNLGNPNLSWETYKNFNVGLDFGFLNDRVSGSVDYYQTKVYDKIGQRSLPITQEINTINYNLSGVEQKRGLEISLNTINISKKDLRWSTNINFTYYRNAYLSRDDNFIPDINENFKEDKGGIWKFIIDGMIPAGNHNAGALRIKDVNGYLRDAGGQIAFINGKPAYSNKPDGLIDNADMVYLGNATPMPFSIDNTVKFKNFDFNIYLNGMLNNWMSNATDKMFGGNLLNVYNYGENTLVQLKDRWSYDNLNSTTPSVFRSAVATSEMIDNYYFEKAWFIRLQNITLGYTLPKNLLKGILSHSRVYGSAKNLFVITPYSGSDPETDSQAAYPNQRAYTVGIEIKF